MINRTQSQKAATIIDISQGRGRIIGEITSDAEVGGERVISEPEPPAPTSDEFLPEPIFDDTKPIFICGRCDMIVGEDDNVCEFCGAEFDDVDEPAGEEHDIVSPEGEFDEVQPERAAGRSRSQQDPGKVDVIAMFGDGRSQLESEHFVGGGSAMFLSFARLLRSVENTIFEAEEFGVDTVDAKGKLLAAWKACHEGSWGKAKQLAEESKLALAPGVSSIVREQVSCFREALVEMKRGGKQVSSFVIDLRTIQDALDDVRLDDAIALTKVITTKMRSLQLHLLDDMA
jgi:hypothetical protein